MIKIKIKNIYNQIYKLNNNLKKNKIFKNKVISKFLKIYPKIIKIKKEVFRF